MTERILVGIDGSNNSLEALEEAVRLAELFNSEIIIINVQPSFHTIHTRLFINNEQLREFQEELFVDVVRSAIKYLQAYNVKYEVILRIGNPIQEICKLADELRVKYIVLGSRGMGMVRGAVLGSVSYGVIHECKTPVLIIPQQRKKKGHLSA